MSIMKYLFATCALLLLTGCQPSPGSARWSSREDSVIRPGSPTLQHQTLPQIQVLDESIRVSAIDLLMQASESDDPLMRAHAIEGLQQLTGYSNLWIDTSVACPPLATIAALRCLGPRRVLYGSDFFCSHIRGTNVGLNDGFAWLDEDLSVWEGNPWIPTMRPVLVGLENLRAVKAAFWALRMSDSEIERYFWGNAAELLRL